MTKWFLLFRILPTFSASVAGELSNRPNTKPGLTRFKLKLESLEVGTKLDLSKELIEFSLVAYMSIPSSS